MFRPFRITLDRFISRSRSKDIYETVFFPFFHIFPAFLQNRLQETAEIEQGTESTGVTQQLFCARDSLPRGGSGEEMKEISQQARSE